MANEIHIERRDRVPISLDEWRAAVERTEGVRMADGDNVIVNLKTKETIRIRNLGGDAEAYFPAASAWERVFYWRSSGRMSFNAPRDFDAPDCVTRNVARALARELGAVLAGNEGEL